MSTTLGPGIRQVVARLAPESATDGQLLNRFLSDRDEAAFAALVRRHGSMVLGTCRRIAGNLADAEDAFQATFVVLTRRAATFRDRACVGNFLYGVAYHSALKVRAMACKRRRHEQSVLRPERSEHDPDLLRALDEELANLPAKFREPVILCELEGRSRREVAGRLGIPEGTVSSRLASAHRQLEKRLRARGFAWSAVAIAALPALAVSNELVESALRAATEGPSSNVSKLIAEVAKAMFLKKLKLGATALGAVAILAGGAIFLPSKEVARAEEKAKPAKEQPVPDPLSAKAIYALPKDQVLKIIPAPFPRDRDYLMMEWAPHWRPGTPYGSFIFSMDGTKAKLHDARIAAHPGANPGETTYSIRIDYEFLMRNLFRLEDQEVYGLNVLDGIHPFDSRFAGDILFRESTPIEKLVPALREQLKTHCKIDLEFRYTHEERTVVRLTGKHKLQNLAPKSTRVDLYATDKTIPHVVVTGYESNSLHNSLSRFIGMAVIDDSDLQTRKVPVQVNSKKRMPPTDKTNAEDCDPERVLKTFAEQTGVGFEFVKRKVRRLEVRKPTAIVPGEPSK